MTENKEIIEPTINNIENIKRYIDFLCREQMKTNELLEKILIYIEP